MQMAKRRPSARVVVLVLVVALVVVFVPATWLVLRSRAAASTASALSVTAHQLQTDAAALDLEGIAADLTLLREQAASLHQVTGDPVWGVATHLPLVGDRAAAARRIGAVADELATAAAPLAILLPRFDAAAITQAAGRIDAEALEALGPVLTSLAAAVGAAEDDLADVDPAGLSPEQHADLVQLRSALGRAQEPLAAAASVTPLLAAFVGTDRRRTWFVALQNLAEARGTGGFIGAYAVLQADAGKVTLVEASSIKPLVAGPRIPIGGLPSEFQQFWGVDATEWNGLNLSPHFPYTGQLVVDGWRARGGGDLDGVIALDQNVVAALLLGTGPITVRDTVVDSASAVRFLTRDIYSIYPLVTDKDAVVAELVQAVFARLAAGQFSLGPLVKALSGPVAQGRLLVYAADADEQASLSGYAIAGILPDVPGPFAMAVVNNGAGNKLDAYLSVTLDYAQGTCSESLRNSSMRVTLRNGAPATGLPAYVDSRGDLPADLRDVAPSGSTNVLLYLYGPVDSENALTTVDGDQVDIIEGLERGHTVWRIDVVLLAGQTRVVDVEVLENIDTSAVEVAPTLGVQPMAIPQVVRATPGSACTAS
jgi:hypothetical protein